MMAWTEWLARWMRSDGPGESDNGAATGLDIKARGPTEDFGDLRGDGQVQPTALGGGPDQALE